MSISFPFILSSVPPSFICPPHLFPDPHLFSPFFSHLLPFSLSFSLLPFLPPSSSCSYSTPLFLLPLPASSFCHNKLALKCHRSLRHFLPLPIPTSIASSPATLPSQLSLPSIPSSLVCILLHPQFSKTQLPHVKSTIILSCCQKKNQNPWQYIQGLS